MSFHSINFAIRIKKKSMGFFRILIGDREEEDEQKPSFFSLILHTLVYVMTFLILIQWRFILFFFSFPSVVCVWFFYYHNDYVVQQHTHSLTQCSFPSKSNKIDGTVHRQYTHRSDIERNTKWMSFEVWITSCQTRLNRTQIACHFIYLQSDVCFSSHRQIIYVCNFHIWGK